MEKEIDTSFARMVSQTHREQSSMIRKAKMESLKERRRKIQKVKEIGGAVLAAVGAAAAIWFFFNAAKILEEGAISEKGGDPNIGYNGEWIGNPNDAPAEFYEDTSSRGR